MITNQTTFSKALSIKNDEKNENLFTKLDLTVQSNYKELLNTNLYYYIDGMTFPLDSAFYLIKKKEDVTFNLTISAVLFRAERVSQDHNAVVKNGEVIKKLLVGSLDIYMRIDSKRN